MVIYDVMRSVNLRALLQFFSYLEVFSMNFKILSKTLASIAISCATLAAYAQSGPEGKFADN